MYVALHGTLSQSYRDHRPDHTALAATGHK